MGKRSSTTTGREANNGRGALIAFLLTVSFGPATVLGVGTSHWTHTSEADFKAGTFEDVVATNLGDLKLSRAVRKVLAQDSRISAVYAMAEVPDGSIYAATGPEGVLLNINGEKVSTAAELGHNVNLVSLLADVQGRLLVGTAGEKGQILRMDNPRGGEPTVIFEADEVQYVWAMTQTPDGTLYAATGPNGQLFQINPDGTHKVLFDSDENNLLSLIGDGGDLLFVGTDPNGLVYRVNRKTGEMFVLYDAAESEIGALARDAAGNIYAATAQATEPEAPEIAQQSEPIGRPEAQPHGVPIPSDRPAPPEPPEIPDPSPGDPLPIPRTRDGVEPRSMTPLAQDRPGGDDSDPGGRPAAPPADDDGSDGGTGDGDDDAPAVPQHDLESAAAVTAQAVGVVGGEPAPGGNAIYRIDRDGFVTEVFRQPVVIYSMIETSGTLLVGTGTGGEVWQIRPAAEETSVLAKVDPKDVLSLLPTRDGRILLGLANSGEIASMTPGFAPEGTYTSPVLDATQISRFGKIRLRGSLPPGTTLKVATRSSNVASASDPGWSPWSEEISASEFVQSPSPAARFLQYRLRFSSEKGDASPVLESVDVAYQLPNLAPQIASVTVAPGEPSPLTAEANPDTHKYTLSWEAADPNDEPMTYRVFFRTGTRGNWILLKDKLNETSYEWETRSVADGVYQIKIEASDAAANAAGQGKLDSRVSDPVLVDNSPPAIGNLKHTVEGRSVKIEMKAVDRAGTVALAAYAVDSSADWQTVLPSDSIADSPEESYRFTVPNLTPGSHQIVLRALDRRGNAAFQTITVNIGK